LERERVQRSSTSPIQSKEGDYDLERERVGYGPGAPCRYTWLTVSFFSAAGWSGFSAFLRR